MVDQATRQLQDPILDQGIQNTNYFNGRLLTAADLQTEQAANRQQHQQLGQSIGAGVVEGFQVRLIDDGSRGGPPIVGVARGLALNRLGYAVALPLDEVQIALSGRITSAPTGPGLFAHCIPPKNGTTPVSEGIYLLVACPATGYEAKAPMRSFGVAGAVDGCGSKYAVEGIQFRLVALELSAAALPGINGDAISAISALLTATDLASLSRLRNLVAHLCFGTPDLIGFLDDPLARTAGQSPFTSYGAIDALRATGKLTDCDVPIALLDWRFEGVQFLDMWSVRRTITPPPHSAVWPLPVSQRRRVEAEAIFLQFQEQMDWLVGRSNLSAAALRALRATDYYRYVPPAGIIPIAGGNTRGVAYRAFFDGLTYRDPNQGPIFIEGAKVEPLLHDALSFPPLDLTSGVMLWLYQVRENVQTFDQGGFSAPHYYLIFTSGHVPYHGEAQFDVNRWSYSTYS